MVSWTSKIVDARRRSIETSLKHRAFLKDCPYQLGLDPHILVAFALVRSILGIMPVDRDDHALRISYILFVPLHRLRGELLHSRFH